MAIATSLDTSFVPRSATSVLLFGGFYVVNIRRGVVLAKFVGKRISRAVIVSRPFDLTMTALYQTQHMG